MRYFNIVPMKKRRKLSFWLL